jgi:hypothetical protein
MGRLLKVMGTGVTIGLALLGLSILLFAQSSPNGSSIGFNASNLGSCQTPTVGITIPCFTPPVPANPTGIMLSLNGAAYVTLNSLLPPPQPGVPGPAGAPGPVGATGQVGPSGPPGVMPTTFTCASWASGTTGTTFSNCK